jgi:dipeptidyl aminopeptidase/acylaminoacyl peptidase
VDLAEDGSVGDDVLVAGGRDESVFQPEWGPDGRLHFSSDRSGWWNLYRVDVSEGIAEPEAIAPMQAEAGRPQWGLGMSIYGFDAGGRIVCAVRELARDRILRLTPGSEPEEIPSDTDEISSLVVRGDTALVSGGSATRHPQILRIDLPSGTAETLRESSSVEVDAGYISVPELIEFPTESGHTAYALYYPPRNPDFRGPDGERPPLLVSIHGGPTAWAGWTLDWGIQLFTSRGIAYVDVDYGGSTGYGREYMRRLDGQWGVVDVDDAVNAARYLAKRGDVDGERLAIHGGSAGGFTTLTALATRDTFKAGISFFGIGDLIRFREDTHKFESRYDQRLIGPWPEAEPLYRERSAINHLDGFNCPVLVLQGLDDRIVPPSQAEQIVDALRRKNLPVAYLAFEGEDHGFRKAESIVRSTEAELSFLAQIFGFTLADEIEPVEIEGLEAATAA